MEKAIKGLNSITEKFLWALLFFIPFSNAGIEIWLHLAVFTWLIKRSLIATTVWKQTRSPKETIKAFRLVPTALNKVIYILAVVMMLSAIASDGKMLALEGMFGKLFTYCFVAFLIVDTLCAYDPRRPNIVEVCRPAFNRLLGAVFFSFTLVVIDGIFQYATGKDFFRGMPLYTPGDVPVSRACFKNPNDYAGWLVVVVPFLMAAQFLKINVASLWARYGIKIALSCLFVCSLLSLFLAYSRASWVACWLSFGFIAVVGFMRLPKKTLINWFALALVLVPTVIGALFFQQIMYRVSMRKELAIKDNYRFELWREAAHIIRDYPILGVGPNNYSRVGISYRLREGGGFYPHNSYLHMTAETGVLGLLAFLLVLFQFFRTGFRRLATNQNILYLGLAAGLVGFFIHSFFDTNLYALRLATFYWYMIGLAMVLSKMRLDSLPAQQTAAACEQPKSKEVFDNDFACSCN